MVVEGLPPGIETLPIAPDLQPLIDIIQPFFSKLSVLLGGIFGVYILLLLVRIYYERKHVRLLQDMRYDLDVLNEHYGLPTSKQRKGWLRRVFSSRKKSKK
ncbi:MAG TPA: hypothetical protein VJC21_05770 [Candidatus Nanoarchaeia archaeon]|uniref:Uncharacterized protein n=1 Tax=Candidatus Harrisonbacteria bacterium RIFCSPLOWO2_02_FULL_45_10c TaxID=1798410 RepID=A0A1G1ZSC4_9BACT|nr:MAG: hypothetical protein A3H63_02810 [Candidatus Harrisonbacteria bacterium RIFCSPLOWO2_02_FULL_45_10c]HLC98256.1 hypothetical protein [Candidatus Nanoarchaeia archaeon]